MNVRNLQARVSPIRPGDATTPSKATREPGSGGTFADALSHERSRGDGGPRISAHAEARLTQRGIELTDGDRQGMADAMRELELKGAQNALMLRGDSAFLVNIPNRTIITAMNAADLSGRAFTNIDSAYLLSASNQPENQ